MILPYRSILITGASSGIGEALAKKFASPGNTLILVARSEDKLRTLAGTLEKSGASVTVITADLSKPDSSKMIFEKLEGAGIDLVVNNAGFGSYGFFHEADIEKENQMILLNVLALVNLTRLFLPGMVKRNHGAIMNISSAASFQPVPFMATYSATKAFVTSFSLAISSELRNTAIRVIDICPGRTQTNFQVISGSHRIRIKSRSASAEQVADLAYRALAQNKRIVIEGFRNNLMTHIQRFFPRLLVLRVTHKIFQPKTV